MNFPFNRYVKRQAINVIFISASRQVFVSIHSLHFLTSIKASLVTRIRVISKRAQDSHLCACMQLVVVI